MLKIKIFTFILSILTTLTLLSITSSCKTGGDNTNNDQSVQGENTSEPENSSENLGRFSRIDTNLPEKDFEGYSFNIVAWFVALWGGTGGNDGSDIWVEEDIGEALNDAVYRRNKTIEEIYNIKMNLIRMDIEDINKSVTNTVAAGDNAYDLVYQRLGNFGSLIQAGYLANLYGVPYLDFDKPWWDKRSVDQQSIDGKSFIAASDLIMTDKNSISCVLFAKQLAQDYAFDNLYEVVKRGEWTIDYLMEICKGKAKDLNGDGILNANDLIPIDGERLSSMILFNGAGSTFALKDENDLPYSSFMSQRNIDICEKILDLMYDTSLYVNTYGETFEKNNSIFYIHQINDVIRFRTLETDFGVLPIPKYERAQESYYSNVSIHQSGLLSIPITAPDVERTGIILEALSAESRFTVMPAYYDLALKSKYLRDDESEDMLDILFNSRIYDLAEFYNFGGLPWQWTSIYDTKGRDIVSMYEKAEGAIGKDIEKLIKTIQNLD